MINLTDKSRDYDKFTKELQLALEKEFIRRQAVVAEERRSRANSLMAEKKPEN